MTKRIFASLLFAGALLAAACGDHVVVPADKTGKCVAGFLTKCGAACVDVQTDNANCGACGTACSGAKVCSGGKCVDACPPGSTRCGDVCSNVDVDRTNCGTCGKKCADNEVCAKGKCAATCEAAGYLTCMGAPNTLDAGGAASCVDPSRDNANCGGCGKSCGADLCSNGVCCAPGLTGCGGQCLDLQADAKNCGACGNPCGMAAPSCVVGQCSKWNNKVLILADNNQSVNVNMKKSFTNAGFATTLIDNGGSTYSGMPAATDFGAVVLVGLGPLNGSDMPMAGQQALVTAQAATTGMVFDAYDAYSYTQQTKLQGLNKILLYTSVTGNGVAGTIQNQSSPFLFVGIPSSFGAANTNAWFSPNGVLNGGSQIAQVNIGSIISSVYSRAMPNGRILHFTWGINWTGGAHNMWTNDPVMTTWFLNGVRWAAGCTN